MTVLNPRAITESSLAKKRSRSLSRVEDPYIKVKLILLPCSPVCRAARGRGVFGADIKNETRPEPEFDEVADTAEARHRLCHRHRRSIRECDCHLLESEFDASHLG